MKMEGAKMKCPTCGAEFPAGAKFCPQCGYVVPSTMPTSEVTPTTNVVYVQPTETTDTNWAAWTAVGLIALLIAGGVTLWNLGYLGNEPSAANPTVIENNTPAPSPPAQINITTPAPKPAPPVVITPPANPPATPPPIIVNPPANPPAAPPVAVTLPSIVSVSGKVLDSTQPGEWRYGYTLRLRNDAARAQHVDVRLHFLDANGDEVGDSVVKTIDIPANTVQTYNGDTYIDAGVAPRITTVKAEFQ
jgi:type IV secretory pathway VirB10-like protein